MGRALVRLLAKRNASIGLLSRSKERLEVTKLEVEKLGGKALVCPVNVSDYKEIAAAAEEVIKAFGPIDVWINNAMVSVFSPAKEMLPEEYKRVTEVTYLGYVYGTQIALQHMREQNRGVIIQVGSALAYRGIPLQSAYCAAKHAVKGFTESIRTELLHEKSPIRISMVQLPALNTPQFRWTKSRLEQKAQPVPPIYQPEVAAQAIIWAIDHYRPEWYTTFSTCIAIIGNKIAPRLSDWYLAKNGYSAQQYNGPRDKAQKDNLYQSPPDLFDAHGDFDSRSHAFSLYLFLTQRRLVILVIFLLLLILLFTIYKK